MTTRRFALVALVVAGFAAAAYTLPLADWVTVLVERMRHAGATGVALFFLAYIASTVGFLPGSILTLVAGFVYGPVWGLAVASPASVAGATCAFLLGRTLLRDWAAKKVSGSARARAIDAAVEREGFKIVLLLRLSPLFPFNVLNYLLSLTRVSTATFILASFVGMLPATAMYVYLGSLAPAAADLASAPQRGGTTRPIMYLVGLVATIAVAVVAARAARRALAAELRTPASS